MKILFINNFFSNYGGAEKSIYTIGTLFRQHGHHIYYFSTDKGQYLENDYKYACYFPKYFNKKEFSAYNVIKILKTFYNFEAKKNLKKFLDEIKPDIAVVHNYHYNLTSFCF